MTSLSMSIYNCSVARKISGVTGGSAVRYVQQGLVKDLTARKPANPPTTNTNKNIIIADNSICATT